MTTEEIVEAGALLLLMTELDTTVLESDDPLAAAVEQLAKDRKQ